MLADKQIKKLLQAYKRNKKQTKSLMFWNARQKRPELDVL